MNPVVTYGGWNGGWRYASPPDVTIRAARFWRVWEKGPTTAGGGRPVLGYNTDVEQSRESGMFSGAVPAGQGDAAQRVAEGNAYDVPLPGARKELAFFVACEALGSTTCSPDAEGNNGIVNQYRLFGARFELEDRIDPTVTNVGGTLTAEGDQSGRRTLAYDAADKGAGVYRTLVFVDDVLRQANVVDDNDGRCRDAGVDATSALEFPTAGVPCRLSKRAEIEFDSASIPDGDHTLRVVLEDAAGNQVSVLGTRPFRTATASVRGRGTDRRPAGRAR